MFKLCLAIGGDKCIHPEILEQHLNRRQIFEWMAYAKIFPFGGEVEEYRIALQTFWLRAAWVKDDLEPKDFLPKFDNEGPKTEAQKIADQILESL